MAMNFDSIGNTQEGPEGIDNNELIPNTSTNESFSTTQDNDINGGTVGMMPLLTRMIAGGGSINEPSAPVPDVLLSLAKDGRYISEVASLLSQVVVPFASIFFLPLRRNNSTNGRNRVSTRDGASGAYDGNEIMEDDGQQFIERLRPELNLMASILVHSATFVFYMRNYGAKKGPVESIHASSAKRSIGMEALHLAYQYPRRTRQHQEKAIYTLANDDRSSRSGSSFLAFKSYRWHYLFFLQTMIPYILQRVDRGGWSKDLGGLASNFLERLGLRPHVSNLTGSRSTAIENGNMQIAGNNNASGSEEENELRNDDRLRGVARRRLFEEQRRRMLNSRSETNSQDESSQENGQINHFESLSSTSHDIVTTDQSASAGVYDRLSKISWTVLRKISLAASSLSHGAHTLPRHVPIASSGEGFDRYTKIIKWFLRLHLAFFYWNGAYPTIAHRLAGARISDNVPPPSGSPLMNPTSGSIVANRPSYKPIAGLIFVQAAAALAQSTAEASVEVAHFIQIAFFRWRRRRRMQQQSEGNIRNVQLNRTDSERAEYLDLIEERVPGIASSIEFSNQHKKRSHLGKHKSSRKRNTDSHLCGICLNERIDPAAPYVCGHVFCWNCILHWVSNVRAECPLCRAQTRPQDIIPLYNYA